MFRTISLGRALRTCSLVALSSALSAQTVTLEANQDNVLIEDPAGALSNGIGPALFSGRVRSTGLGLIRRSLVAFDLSSIPPGSTINSASLQMVVNLTPNMLAYDFDLFAVTTAWGEGTSNTSGGIGAPSTPGDATWLHSDYPGTLWNTVGGDYVGTSSATTTIAGNGTYTWTSAQLAADVQSWVNNPSSNFGWILIGDESTITTAKRFASREDPDPLDRPQLTVTYTPCGTSAMTSFRNGGSNPASYTAGTMVLGSTFQATVDNALAGQVLSRIFAFDTSFSLTLSGGQELLCIDFGSGELLTGGGAAPSSSGGGMDFYTLNIPSDPALCGFVVYSQSIQFGSPPFTLSNAQDITLGN